MSNLTFKDSYQEVAGAAVHIVSHQFWRTTVSWDLSYLAYQGITYDAVDPVVQIATKTVWWITIVPEKELKVVDVNKLFSFHWTKDLGTNL